MPLSERQRAISDRLQFDDAGLSRAGIVQVTVAVTPQIRSTRDGDLVLRGYVDEKEIEVVFPASRQAQVTPLLRQLQQKVRVIRQEEVSKGGLSLVDAIKQQLRIDGIWRVRLLAEINGMPVRRFQLVAARWRFHDADGVLHVGGEMPVG